MSTAGSGSTRTRWPESGHHPTTRPGGSPPRPRSASTRVTRASSARAESRRGPESTTRWARSVRTSARPRSASRAECGLSHQWSRPITGGDGKAAQSRAHQRRVAQVTACAATAARPAGGSPASQRSSGETHGLPSRTHAPDSASRVRTASAGERAPPSASRAHRRQAERAPGRPGGPGERLWFLGPHHPSTPPPHRPRRPPYGAPTAERHPHLVVRDAERSAPGAEDRQARQDRGGVVERGAPRRGVEDRQGGQQRAGQALSHARRAARRRAPRPPRRSRRARRRDARRARARCSSRTSSTP